MVDITILHTLKPLPCSPEVGVVPVAGVDHIERAVAGHDQTWLVSAAEV